MFRARFVDAFATLGKSRMGSCRWKLCVVCLRLECFCFGSTGLSCMPKPRPGGMVSVLQYFNLRMTWEQSLIKYKESSFAPALEKQAAANQPSL